MKYPDQDIQYRRGAWAGDGVKSQPAKAPKRERRAQRTGRDGQLWQAAVMTENPVKAFREMKYGN